MSAAMLSNDSKTMFLSAKSKLLPEHLEGE